MSIGIQGGARREVAQHAGHSLDTNSVLEGDGERSERRRWREERGERVAAVGKKRACFDRRSFCRVPQQGEQC